MRKGKLIVFEGFNYSGRATVSKNVFNALSKIYGDKVVLLRESGGCKISEQIREVLLNNKEIDNITESLLILATRRQFFVEKLKPLLNKGYIVILDRFKFSNIAYQGYGNNGDIESIEKLNQYITDGIMTDILIYVDIDIYTMMERIEKNNDKIDKKDLEFYEKVRQGFREIMKKSKFDTGSAYTIDGESPTEELTQKVLKILKWENLN